MLSVKNFTFLLVLFFIAVSCSHDRPLIDVLFSESDSKSKESSKAKKRLSTETDSSESKKKKVRKNESPDKKKSYAHLGPRKKDPDLKKQIRQYCRKIDTKFHKMGWGKSECEKYQWHHVRNSVKGDPLMWAVYGNENAHRKKRKNMTMILCGVHGDEITPIKFCFDIIHHLDKHLDEIQDNLVVVAPIVNPDSFFKKRPTRTNARGVDVNRNFPTRDWKKDALRLWRRRYGSDKRRYPGKSPLSEPEVLFQVNLIKRYGPDKIISVHAPLTILDYDGPREKHDNNELGKLANRLLVQMSEKAGDYQVRNYPFFPGSLGNYAGNERKIPTYTLELPSSDNRKSEEYWALFKDSIHSAVLHDFREASVAMDQKEESSNRNN